MDVLSGSRGGHKNVPRAGAPLLWGKAERVGAVQPAEEKAPGRPCSSLPVPERGPAGKMGTGFLAWSVATGPGVMALN